MLARFGVVWGIVWFGSMVKRALEAQSAVVQDVERLSKMKQDVIDFFDPRAQLQREQASRARFKDEMADSLKEMEKFFRKLNEQSLKDFAHTLSQEISGVRTLLETMLPFLYPELRKPLIEAADLSPDYKAFLQTITWYDPVIDDASLEHLWERERNSPFDTPLSRLARARAVGSHP